MPLALRLGTTLSMLWGFIGGNHANHAGFELLAKSLHLEFLTVCNHKSNLYICLSFTKEMQVHSSIAMY